ncbi:MAG: type IV pilus modification protein PilV [Proteobacteria bacterium]|nr:type IV pilus modification protein PilV [Pseudomonadota bacterium]
MIRANLPRDQRGVGLLEVMIAVLLVSIGFLAMAALQARALSTNNSAMARSMATVATYSMFDAMRADVAQAQAGAYNKTFTANSCPAAAASLASVQINQWCRQLGNTLGAVASTTGTIACSNTASCTVTIAFDDSRGGAGGTSNQTVQTAAQL